MLLIKVGNITRGSLIILNSAKETKAFSASILFSLSIKTNKLKVAKETYLK